MNSSDNEHNIQEDIEAYIQNIQWPLFSLNEKKQELKHSVLKEIIETNDTCWKIIENKRSESTINRCYKAAQLLNTTLIYLMISDINLEYNSRSLITSMACLVVSTSTGIVIQK